MLYHTTNLHGGDVYDGEIQLDFSANTNPYGTPQGVLDAITAALPRVHQYPDPYCRELVKTISEFESAPKDWILCGSGAAELIYSYCEALRPGRAMELAPTFSEYSLALERVGCQVERYSLKKENYFSLTEDFLPALERSRPDVLFLCNPNNPTGQVIGLPLLEKILDVCEEQGTCLFVDECFLDLSDDGVSLKSHLGEHPNLFILKAFTKSYGMAGVRLGYCLCAQGQLLEEMSHTVQPWNVSTLAQSAGVAALHERAFLQRTRALIPVERQWMQSQLEALGFWVCPSKANYLLFQGSQDLWEQLRKQGIAIRSCGNYYGLGTGWYRIAVRLHGENECLIRAMKEVCTWQKIS